MVEVLEVKQGHGLTPRCSSWRVWERCRVITQPGEIRIVPTKEEQP